MRELLHEYMVEDSLPLKIHLGIRHRGVPGAVSESSVERVRCDVGWIHGADDASVPPPPCRLLGPPHELRAHATSSMSRGSEEVPDGGVETEITTWGRAVEGESVGGKGKQTHLYEAHDLRFIPGDDHRVVLVPRGVSGEVHTMTVIEDLLTSLSTRC